jgi:ABC-type multidrug transport system fused ATPase/permease subunit
MWRRTDTRRVLAMMARYGRPYRLVLGSGLGATVLVVALRLAMPWPLRGVVEAVFPSDRAPVLSGWLPGAGDPVAWLAGAYLLLALASGVAEMAQRVRMKQYSVALVHDMRADAVRSAARGGGAQTSSGDLLARIIGDSARIKEGLSGILVHLSQNGLLFLGVAVVFLVLHPMLGLVFVGGGVASIWVGFVTVPSVATVAGAQRSNEGRFAETVREALKHGDLDDADEAVDRKSAAGDVRTTKLITRSGILVHGVFGATVGAGLWIGAAAVRSGTLAPGALFLFIAYALTVHRRIVQVGRQIARSGKVFATAERLAELIGESEVTRAEQPAKGAEPLRTSLRVEGLSIAAQAAGSSGAGSGAITLSAGTRVAVVGESHEHVSRLLRVLAGREAGGPISWDGAAVSADELARRVAYLPPAPVFPRGRLWRLLGLASPWLLGDRDRKSLKRIGAWGIVKASRGRLKARLGSQDLAEDDARALALGAALVGPAAVLVLDGPLGGSAPEARRRRMSEILRRAEGRTLVASMPRPVKLRRFDRVLVVEAGGIVYDGSAAAFEAERTARAG